jgi:hypothetical protein
MKPAGPELGSGSSVMTEAGQRLLGVGAQRGHVGALRECAEREESEEETERKPFHVTAH